MSAVLEEGNVPDLELAKETVYLIDKVIRRKAREGPIGVDNSELINMEMEKEFKIKNQHILELAGQPRYQEEEDLQKENDRFVDRLADHVRAQ